MRELHTNSSVLGLPTARNVGHPSANTSSESHANLQQASNSSKSHLAVRFSSLTETPSTAGPGTSPGPSCSELSFNPFHTDPFILVPANPSEWLKPKSFSVVSESQAIIVRNLVRMYIVPCSLILSPQRPLPSLPSKYSFLLPAQMKSPEPFSLSASSSNCSAYYSPSVLFKCTILMTFTIPNHSRPLSVSRCECQPC
jgi:hypothetical protein